MTTIQAPEPTAPSTGTATYYYDGVDERLTLTYDNALLAGVGRLDGDLTDTPLAAVAFIPPVFAGFTGAFYRGGWGATLAVSR